MRRLVTMLLLLALMGSACAGPGALDDSGGGIAALEDERRSSDGKKNQAKKKDRGNDRGKDVPSARRSRSRRSKTTKPPSGVQKPTAPDAKDTTDKSGRKRARSAGTTVPAAAAIPADTYEYATQGQRTVSGNREQMPSTTTLTAESPANEEQRQIRDLRDGDGNGTVTESRLLYRSDGVFLTYVKVTSKFPGGLTDVREFRLPRPQLLAPTGGGPGFERSFSMEGSGTRADVALRALRYEKVHSGGEVVRSLVVTTRIVFSGALEGEQTAVAWFWPKHVMVLKERVETDVRNGPIRLRSDYEATLKELP